MGLGKHAFSARLRDLGIDADAERMLASLYVPVAEWISTQYQMVGKPIVIGVNGAQGAGKTTFCALLTPLLERDYRLRVVTISIDDVYHTRSFRKQLARTIHPLCAIRGVPGTHDIELAHSLLDRLLTQKPGMRVEIPRFDKASDDRKAATEWDSVVEPVDVILFEGWCVACPPLPAWQGPYNAREAREDENGVWSRWSAACLLRDYGALFDRLDGLMMLQVPSIDSVRRGRWRQEQALWQRSHPSHASLVGRMTEADVYDYVSLFERYTEHMFRYLPDQADLVITRDDDFCYVLKRCPHTKNL